VDLICPHGGTALQLARNSSARQVREENYVRKLVLKTLVVIAVAGAPAFAIAQDADADRARVTQSGDDDRSNWGLLGLLGLAGLIGLKRRDREEVIDRTRATAR
jgi:MYXO-CTERM domain-containing protein